MDWYADHFGSHFLYLLSITHLITHLLEAKLSLHFLTKQNYTLRVNNRGGVLEDVLGLEDTFWSPWPWPWPRSLRSSKIALSSARGQHCFLSRWNFVGKRHKPRGKFANTFFVFRNWSIGLAKRASPPNWNFTNDKNVTKKPIVFSVLVSF